MIRTHVLVASDDDYSFIRSNRKEAYKTPWMVPKIATPGDNAILFHRGVGFVATAEIMTAPQSAMFGNKKCYKADIQAKNISPVAFATIIKKVPNWKWTNYPKSYTTIEGDIEKRVWDLIGNQHSSKKQITYPDEIVADEKIVEGAKKSVTVNAYERSDVARSQCLQHWGTSCSICRIDFEKKYGSVAAGYIHVHHLKSLASIGKSYKVNPVKDLIPVCPNCHAVIHLSNPPMAIDAMKKLTKK